LLKSVGIENTVASAQKLNIGTPPSVPSIALGSSDVTLLALTSAFGAFAAKGIVREPILVRRVEDSEGHVLYQAAGEAHQAISEATAYLMASMLQDVVNYGTAYRARQSGFTLPAAGKTGTTNDYVDAWFVGFTPHVVTGVWVGFDQPRTIVSNGYGGELAVPIWASFMKAATKGDKAEWFERPANVISVNVCRVSGKLPNSGCGSVQVISRDGFVESQSMIYTDYFVRGTQPTDLCPLHAAPSLLDRLAGVFGGGDNDRAVSAEDAGLPVPRPARTSGEAATSAPSSPSPSSARPANQPQPQQKVEEPKKKRGFWSRIFGRGDDDKKKDDKKNEKKKPGGGR
jgi:penicillin-binding protein 1A